MKTVFIGGSRSVSRLPGEAKTRLGNVLRNRLRVVVGDANGVDKAVQRYFAEAKYEQVTVFCSGEHPRNNLGEWHERHITPSPAARGFQFHAAKDRAMAREADYGFMIWDGKSPGSVLNILRLIREGKPTVLLNAAKHETMTITTPGEWHTFLLGCDSSLQTALQERATPEEWLALAQPSLFDTLFKVQTV